MQTFLFYTPRVFLSLASLRCQELFNSLASLRGDEVGVESGVENNVDKILNAISAEPKATQKRLADMTGFSTRTISREIKNLRDTGVIRRIDSDRSGYWEIVK